MIDGAVTPWLFSDEYALYFLLRMAAHPDDGAGRAYIRNIFNSGTRYEKLSTAETEAIRAVAVDYARRVRTLYESELPDINPELKVMAPVYRAKLTSLLGTEGHARLAQALAMRIKPKLRKFNNPSAGR